LVTLPGSALQ